MKVRMLLSLAGSDFALSSGDETERFGDAEALRLIEAAYAVAVAPAPETPAPEPASNIAAGGVESEPLAAGVMEGAAGDDTSEPKQQIDLVEASTTAEVEAIGVGDAIVADGEQGRESADQSAPAAVSADTENEPMLVEDATERAVRNPVRKRRG
jgi:hypothetical protein